jgi:hypothetical protein
MWLRLETLELEQIVTSLRVSLNDNQDEDNRRAIYNLIEKINETPDPDTHSFASAVETNDNLEVDGDVVISRGDEGAFVMSWSWVSNEAAGIEPEADAQCENCGSTDNDGSDTCTDCGGKITSEEE